MQYQNMRNSYANQEKIIFDGAGTYQIPPIPRCDMVLDQAPEMIRFDGAIRERHPGNKIVHFFTDDFLFDRVWNSPERYISVLARFKAVIAPDFSLYADHPKVIQIYNHFRKHWCAAYWASLGITVIPCIRWVEGDISSYDWCFDGEPTGGLVCISTHGSIKGDERKRLYRDGYAQAIEALHPSAVLLYGDMCPDLPVVPPIIHTPNERMRAKRKYCRKAGEVKKWVEAEAETAEGREITVPGPGWLEAKTATGNLTVI